MKSLYFSIVVVLAFLVSCKKDTLPVVESLTASIEDATHAALYGNVSDEGSDPVTSRGFCWAFHPDPSIDDNYFDHSSGAGLYTVHLGILPDSTYYARAYATNSIGTAYGIQLEFSTVGTYTGTFDDSRDGNNYRWVRIGTQIWMSENLAYLPEVSPPSVGAHQEAFYYVAGYAGNDVQAAIATENYRKYGVLYNWKALQSACPSGWHTPSDNDWMILEEYLGMNVSELEEWDYRASGSVGKKIKSSTGWSEGGNGNNNSGLNILPAGGRNTNGEFAALGLRVTFRTGNAGGSTFNFSRSLSYDNDGIHRGTAVHNSGLPARCIKY